MKRSSALFAALWCAAVGHANPAFDNWAEEFAQEWVRASPMAATQSQYLAAAEQDLIDRKLELRTIDGMPVRAEDRAALVARATRGLAELERFPATTLTPVQRTSAAFLRARLRNTVRVAEVSDQVYVFDQFRGAHISLVSFLTQTHPRRTRRDLENYLARLEQVAPLLQIAIAEAKARAERGVVPPRFILTSSLASIDRLLEPTIEKDVLVTTLAEAAGKFSDLTNKDRDALTTKARMIVSDAVRPALEDVRTLLRAQQKVATDDAGVWKLPRGRELYEVALETFTTTKLSADEIHAIGLREVARIDAEMDKLLRGLGYIEGKIQTRYAELQAKLIPSGTPDPRPAMLAEITKVVADAQKRAESLFLALPKAPIEVRREPAFSEAGAAARYSLPAPDGSQPGIYWIPLGRLTPDVIWIGAGTRSVAYHEAVPGHHFQLVLEQESKELPRFRKLSAFGFLSVYSEGWALYAERIADEAGWYEGDVNGRLGYLSFQLFRARRLVVDTGLHAKKWTRQQAIDYGIQASEVERYTVWPGQACSYMIGQLRILELREKAKAALGAKFSLPHFHDVVLRTGAVPLDVLDTVVNEWVAANR